MKKLHLLFLTITFCWAAISTANPIATDDNGFAVSDFDTVSEAVDSIKAKLEDQGLEIVGVIDHAANAKKVDLKLPPTQLILFRDHRLEKRLLRRGSSVAIDLPQKILVWEDQANNEIKLLYNTAGYLSDRHSIRPKDPLQYRLNKSLQQFGKLNNGLVTIDSAFSVEETVENLKTTLLENGFIIPFTFDFTKKSSHQHYQKSSQLIIFGNPKAGTPLMQNQQSIGVDLPQKFLVWQDRQGQVHITYNDPAFIGKRHGLQGLDTVLSNIGKRLRELASEVAGVVTIDQSTTLIPWFLGSPNSYCDAVIDAADIRYEDCKTQTSTVSNTLPNIT